MGCNNFSFFVKCYPIYIPLLAKKKETNSFTDTTIEKGNGPLPKAATNESCLDQYNIVQRSGIRLLNLQLFSHPKEQFDAFTIKPGICST